jgi:hypothetical protein
MTPRREVSWPARVWRRLRYAWPAARRTLLEQLVDAVARGEVYPVTALARYEAETRLLPWNAFFAPGYATHRLIRAGRGERPGLPAAARWRWGEGGFVLRLSGPGASAPGRAVNRVRG